MVALATLGGHPGPEGLWIVEPDRIRYREERHSETRDLNTDKVDSRLSRFDESPLRTVLERDEIPKNYQRTLRPLYRLNF